jgi:hypothetical protein
MLLRLSKSSLYAGYRCSCGVNTKHAFKGVQAKRKQNVIVLVVWFYGQEDMTTYNRVRHRMLMQRWPTNSLFNKWEMAPKPALQEAYHGSPGCYGTSLGN